MTAATAALGIGKGAWLTRKSRDGDPGFDREAILSQAVAGDAHALGILYDRYSGAIYNYIYQRVGQAQLAEDITAQVFLRMLQAVRADRAWHSSFTSWLYRIAHNLIVDHYRSSGRMASVDLAEAESVETPDKGPSQVVETRLQAERIHRALNQLTPDQAQVITLRFLQEMSIAEAAMAMDRSEAAIKTLQYRAVRSLRDLLVNPN